jgi:glycerol-3-phosphate O-acyltransferase
VGGVAFTEIAHNYDQKVIDHLYVTFSRYFERTLDAGKPTVQGLENLLTIPTGTSVVLVSTHKSHLDYVVVPWVLRHHQTPKGEKPLAIAAGDNLFKKIAKWDFNKFLRKAGGYKIIRQPEQGKKISTTETLLKYTTERMGAGDWFLIFPEKGRSYTGEVLPFDSAAMGIFQRAEKRAGRKVVYVPMSIGYERVPEDRWFASFAQYKSSQSRFKKMLYYALDWPLIAAQQYLGIGNKPIGHISVRFGAPMTSSDGNSPLNKEAFAAKLEDKCKSVVPAFSTNIVCAAFLQNDPRNVAENIVEIYGTLKKRGVLAENATFDNIIPRAYRFLDAPFRRFFHTGIAYGFARKDIMEYYSKGIAHYLKSQHDAPKIS